MKSKIVFQGVRRRQRGISLLIGLVMLVLLTLLGISAFNASNISLRILGNTQVRQETLSAAQTATEQLVSSPDFIKAAPAAAVVALNGASYTVNFTPAPACTSVIDIPSEDLNPALPDDLVCIPSGALQETGVFITGVPLPPSYCSNTRWNITADVADANTSAKTTVVQGIAVRVAKGNALTYCP